MLSNLLGFDIEAELRCASTRRWIRKEDQKIRKMERNRKFEAESEIDIESEDDSDEGIVSISEIFQREHVERKQKEEEEREDLEDGKNSIQTISDSST